MTDISTSALITFQDVVEYMGKDPTKPGLSQERVNLFINGASDRIVKYCGRPFLTTADRLYTFCGDGTISAYVDMTPITDTPTIYYWDGNEWIEADSTSYPRSVDTASGKVWFNDGGTFHKGEDNWRIKFSAGYTQETLPSDIKIACLVLVDRAMKKADGREGVASESFANVNRTFDYMSIPSDVREILDSYKRYSI